MFVPRIHRRVVRGIAITILLCLVAAAPVHSGPATLPAGFTDTQLAGSLDQPVALAIVPDAGPAPRILFAEQKTARVGLIVGANVSTVGVVPDVETSGGERGLLGITVDPAFPLRPFLYVHATDTRGGGRVAISRFTLTGDLDHSGAGLLTFEPPSRYDVLADLPDDADFHNGGTVRFGPDGMLYVSLGDDGVRCDAQSPDEPAGKILRVDVSGLPAGPGGPAPFALLTPGGNPYASDPDSSARLVWTLGLRNPFRFHIDAATGALFVADVGENQWEELTRFPAGGLNGGWPWREGPEPFGSCSGQPPAFTEPIAVYDHSEGAVVISAGVYRAPASSAVRFPAAYEGNAFYLDYYTGFMRRLVGSGSIWSPAPPVPGQPNADDWGRGFGAVSDVRALPDGSMIYVRQSVSYAGGTGEVRRIAYPQTAAVPPQDAAALAFATPRPSPSRGAVTFAWTQPVEARVRLAVLDVTGRVVVVLEDGAGLPAGAHERVWDGRGAGGARVHPGLYFARLDVAGDTRAARVVRLD